MRNSLENLFVLSESGVFDGGVAPTIDGIHVGTVLDEEVDDLYSEKNVKIISFRSSEAWMNWNETKTYIDLAFNGSDVKSRSLIVVDGVHVGALSDGVLDEFDVSHGGSIAKLAGLLVRVG
jgi:hypothetical protein